jgi:hypothetical protein
LKEIINTILVLTQRYDYGGAYELMNEIDLEDTDAGILINMCRSSVNFDFKSSQALMLKLSKNIRLNPKVKLIEKNINDLVKGEPTAMFGELVENAKFQLLNEEYIDFLGRIYRFKEAIYKYIFIKHMYSDQKFYFVSDAMTKKTIIKVLKKKYKIFNSNINYSVSLFINKYMKDEYNILKVDKILSMPKMDKLLELRHESIVGHGFGGVSIHDIYRIYGNPYNVLDDFVDCLEILGLKINTFKYANINEILNKELKTLEEINEKEKSNSDN